MEEKTLYDKLKVKNIWQNLKNLSKVIFATGIVAFLALTISLLSIHLSPYISTLSIYLGSAISLKLNSTSLIDLMSNSLLISVTVVYVMATYGIVKTTEDSIKQNQKSNEIAFTEKRLECLYYPLKLILESPENTELNRQGKPHSFNDKEHQLDDVFPYLYLATDELEDPLKELIFTVKQSGPEFGMIIKNNKHLIEKIKKQVDIDIDMFKEQLIYFVLDEGEKTN